MGLGSTTAVESNKPAAAPDVTAVRLPVAANTDQKERETPQVPPEVAKARELLQKNLALFQQLPPEAQQFMMRNLPLRVSTQFLRDVDSLSAQLSALPKEGEGKLTQGAAMEKLLQMHVQAHALIRSSVAVEIINTLPGDLDPDTRVALEKSIKQLGWAEKKEQVAGAASAYITALTTAQDPPHLARELGAFLKDIQTTLKADGVQYISDPQALKTKIDELSKITGRPSTSFTVAPTGLNLEQAVNLVHGVVSSEFLIDNLSLTGTLGWKGDALPSWDKIEGTLKKQLGEMRNTERDAMVGNIMSILKNYDGLKDRRDEIQRIGDKQVSDSHGWDIYIPIWHAKYFVAGTTTLGQHEKEMPAMATINNSFLRFQTAVQEQGSAWGTIARDARLQQSVESVITARGAYLIDSTKRGYYIPDAANYQKAFLEQRQDFIRSLPRK